MKAGTASLLLLSLNCVTFVLAQETNLAAVQTAFINANVRYALHGFSRS